MLRIVIVGSLLSGNLQHEGTLSASAVARIRMESLIGFIKDTEREKPSILTELKQRKPSAPKHETKNKTEMER